MWCYCRLGEVGFLSDTQATDSYARGRLNVDFHRCRECGCVTHWVPRDKKRDRLGVNARLLPPEVLAAATVKHRITAAAGRHVQRATR